MRSFKDFLSTAMTVLGLRDFGTTAWCRDVFEMSVKTSFSWSEHLLRIRLGAMCSFMGDRIVLTRVSVKLSFRQAVVWPSEQMFWLWTQKSIEIIQLQEKGPVVD